ncbi:hypothetical protein RJ641_030957, partial [Dillenia turbinata]
NCSFCTFFQVYCTHTAPDYSLPWQKQRQFTSTGKHAMSFYEKLLTNAHCVEHQTQVKVKRRGDDTKYVAKDLARGVECDIALLSVESEEFWNGAETLHFGRLPLLQDVVTVVGYPLGGGTISVTKGVVSQIEVTSYAHGNSGGPAFNDQGECIGVAFPVGFMCCCLLKNVHFEVFRSEEAKNIGYVIPTTVVSHLLNDYERNGKYTGFACLGVLLQKLENPALRACLKVPSNEGDVIVSFDGVHVGCEGTVPFLSNECIAFSYLISQKQELQIFFQILVPGCHVMVLECHVAELGIIRAGNFMKVNVVLDPSMHLLKLLAKARYSLARFKGERIVKLSRVMHSNCHSIALYDVLANEYWVRGLGQPAGRLSSMFKC